MTNKNDYGDSFEYKNSKKVHFEDVYSNNTKTKNKKKVKSIIIITVCIIFAITGCAMIYGYNALNSLNYEPIDNNSQINGLEQNGSSLQLDLNGNSLLSDPMVLNVLLLGSDSYSAGDGGRSDSILLVSIDNRNKKLKFTSFLRDLWVTIPCYGEDRLNAAYALGGAKLTVQTIEGNFGVNIDRYVIADFVGFESIINRLGGIDIYLTSEECEYLNTHCDDPNKLYGEGLKHLTGLQALNHARNRDSVMSDFDRTSRQRDVLTAVVKETKTASLPQIVGIISDAGPMITTNFKKTEIATLAKNSLTYLNYPISQFSLPELENFSNSVINGAYVLEINNMDTARLDLAKFIFEASIVNDSESSSK